MASSGGNAQTLYGATSAPPPTPSAPPSSSHRATSGAADLLAGLLRRLPPTLSLPTRRQHPPAAATATHLPTLSFNDESSGGFATNLSSASGLGFFELTGHGIPVELACSAEAESLALFDLPREQKGSCFPRNWPLGYEAGDDEDGSGDSFCLDSRCSSESLPQLASLREFTREMERVGLRVVEWLSDHFGFKNPYTEDPTRLCSFMWVSQAQAATSPQDGLMSGGFYPFAVGLVYQIRPEQRYSMLTDSGRVSVMPEAGSLLATIGDVAQVWSNGKLKKVRGRPIPLPCSESNDDAATTMTLLVTLPLESTVSPLIPLIPEKTLIDTEQEGEATEQEGEEEDDSSDKAVFSSFPFEDYAWRVYHERLSFKDPLDRYRI